ncbi:MAG: tetratricopeptide repeat protein [Bacteroidetes bacterium]|nr:tetratricopeptide repeat protein [Bacteroidota bacterium]
MKRPYLPLLSITTALSLVCCLASCKNAQQLVTAGRQKLAKNPDKAARSFRMALAKDPICAEAYFGLGDVASAKGDLNGAIANKENGVKLAPNAYAQHWDLMRWYCQQRNSTGAVLHMYYLYSDSLYHRYIRQSDTIPALDLIRQTAGYRRWHAGIRRLKIQPLDAFSNETDKGTENDQFVTIVSEGRVVLATKTIENKNQAYWTKDYVILDSYIDSLITVTQLDDDYMFCDVLSSGTIDPHYTGERMIRATNSHLRLIVSDCYDAVHTTGTALPTTPSLSTTLKSVNATRVLSNPEELDKTRNLK